MILLDTDHISLLQYGEGVRFQRIIDRIDRSSEIGPLAVPIISIEEQMRGWLAVIAKERRPSRQVTPYRELRQLFQFFRRFMIVDFDDDSVEKFEQLRTERLRVGSMDLKIAAIAIANNALLLTSNLRDFERIPGLRVENWAD